MGYKKMTLIPTRAGYIYECFYCKEQFTPENADSHPAHND